jgi:hypothetical protein
MTRRRAVVLGVIAGLLVGALGACVVLGLWFPRPDASAIDNAQKTLRVTATIEQKPVREPVDLSAIVQVATAVPIGLLGADAESGRTVVSGAVRGVGETIGYGDLVAEVSGHPVFAMPADVPLFRDLVPGDSGNDVAGVQRVLVDRGLLGEANGKFDNATLRALTEWFKAAGYRLPELEPAVPSAGEGDPGKAAVVGLPLASASTAVMRCPDVESVDTSPPETK